MYLFVPHKLCQTQQILNEIYHQLYTNMSNSADFQSGSPSIALFPSAGMGHLTPFLRLASMLSARGCQITLIIAKPTVSMAESKYTSWFLTNNPRIKSIEFHPTQNLSVNSSDDPFFVQMEAISRSIPLLYPLLSSLSHPISAIFCDLVVASGIDQIASDLSIPYYVVSTTSANFQSLLMKVPITKTTGMTHLEMPGMTPIPLSSIPPPLLFSPDSLFTTTVLRNAQAVTGAKGILINSFDWFESETLSALGKDRMSYDLPPLLPIGPLETYELEKDQSKCVSWLDKQPAESVVYVSFGSRTAMSDDQIRELGDGVDKSGSRFLWVLKTEKIDREDREDLKDLLGDAYLKRTKEKGIVVKSWVNQQEILAHPAVRGFISHCGWNSVMEAAQHGVPVLAWPLNGDQRVNAEIVEKKGLGIWERSWGWAGERLVKGEEIKEKILELMEDAKLHAAKNVRVEAKKGHENGGSSQKVIMDLIQSLSQKKLN